jgi:hypothetical protein
MNQLLVGVGLCGLLVLGHAPANHARTADIGLHRVDARHHHVEPEVELVPAQEIRAQVLLHHHGLALRRLGALACWHRSAVGLVVRLLVGLLAGGAHGAVPYSDAKVANREIRI